MSEKLNKGHAHPPFDLHAVFVVESDWYQFDDLGHGNRSSVGRRVALSESQLPTFAVLVKSVGEKGNNSKLVGGT